MKTLSPPGRMLREPRLLPAPHDPPEPIPALPQGLRGQTCSHHAQNSEVCCEWPAMHVGLKFVSLLRKTPWEGGEESERIKNDKEGERGRRW